MGDSRGHGGAAVLQLEGGAGVAERLSPEGAERVMLDYGRRFPRLMKELARMMGYRIERRDEDYRALGRLVPVVRLRPVESDGEG